MKALKIILSVIAFLVIIFFIGGLFLPKTYSVTRSININAPAAVVYSNIADFNRFLEWNPWSKMEPSAKEEISGTAAQAGHLYSWQGEKVGKGQMMIKNIELNKLINIEMKFIEPFENNANTKFVLEDQNPGTKVTWSMQGENNSIAERWMSLIMDGMLGRDFENGLKSLKEMSEK